MRKRFLLTLGMVAAMSVSIVGCSGSSSSSGNKATTESEATTKATTATEATSEENTSEDTANAASSFNGVGDIFEYIGQNSQLSYTISPKAKDFLNDHPELSPADDIDTVKKYLDTSIEHKKVAKNPNKYGNKIMKTPECYVIKADESGEGDSTMTEIQMADNDLNYYYAVYIGSLDIYKDDTVEVYGVPVAMTSFQNVNGGTTISLVMSASYVHKTNE